ncbi:MAG: DUF547 domain-containing protein [Chitinivibrionales bacterium]|nr:DUF547 domain-containing protein [Chitinivibrionales bacterium]
MKTTTIHKMIRRYFLFVLTGVFFLSHFAYAAKPLDYSKYSAVFYAATGVKGKVDYEWLKKNPAQLNTYVRDIAKISKERYRSWSRDEKVAFYINTFNALCIKIIVDNYPIDGGFFKSLIYPDNSILQINGAFNKIKFTVLGEQVTLEDIRDEILIKEFNEPRVHCALAYGAQGSPSLPGRPYEGEELDAMLRFAAREVVADSTMFRIDKEKNKLYISELFAWHGEDFIPEYGTDEKFKKHEPDQRAVVNFFFPFLLDEDKKFLTENEFDIKYIKFNWRLNDKKGEFFIP